MGKNDRTGRAGAFRFVVRFALVTGTLMAAYYFPYERSGSVRAFFATYLAAYARLAGAVLSCLDPSVHVSGTMIAGRTGLVFAQNCDAMDVFMLFVGAVVAYPARWSGRVAGVLVGLVSLVLLNVLRIVSLYFIRVHAPSHFDFVHMDVWPGVIVLFASGGFFVWAKVMGGLDPARLWGAGGGAGQA